MQRTKNLTHWPSRNMPDLIVVINKPLVNDVEPHNAKKPFLGEDGTDLPWSFQKWNTKDLFCFERPKQFLKYGPWLQTHYWIVKNLATAQGFWVSTTKENNSRSNTKCLFEASGRPHLYCIMWLHYGLVLNTHHALLVLYKSPCHSASMNTQLSFKISYNGLGRWLRG